MTHIFDKLDTHIGAAFTDLLDMLIVIDAFEAEEFAEVATKPLKALPYDTPG
ncbi:hypothetical protein HanXRQr2_Chr09g0387711 [Helianthus annuus]|uniref:Uncharacterized protein n=1 Tax=Helianthus annuus TaxID=4232 RepID=A0A9K3I697_HELAN|nr:hypothetical protein HanXRQr2_Chr09g0387711 [Helianthus annuus]